MLCITRARTHRHLPWTEAIINTSWVNPNKAGLFEVLLWPGGGAIMPPPPPYDLGRDLRQNFVKWIVLEQYDNLSFLKKITPYLVGRFIKINVRNLHSYPWGSYIRWSKHSSIHYIYSLDSSWNNSITTKKIGRAMLIPDVISCFDNFWCISLFYELDWYDFFIFFFTTMNWFWTPKLNWTWWAKTGWTNVWTDF